MKKFLCVVFVVAIFLFSAVCVCFAEEHVEVIATGEDEITAKITTDFEYCAASFELEYNKAALQFESSVFSEALSGAMALINPDYSQNSIKLSVISTQPIPAGEICEIRFLKKEYYGGEASLNIVNATFADSNEEVIEFEASGAKVDFPQKYIGGSTAPSVSVSGGLHSGGKKTNSDKSPQNGETTIEAADTEVDTELMQTKEPFDDVSEDDWYYNAVAFAFEKGIAKGVSDTTFAPLGKVTRGQFITMLCRGWGIGEMNGDNFDDCGDAWYTGYLAAAKQLGISNGVGDNMFAPEREISREEMVTLIYNYLKSVGKADGQHSVITFADGDSVAGWAKTAVAFAEKSGIVNGKDNNMFDPKGSATRAELAQIFHNILK